MNPRNTERRSIASAWATRASIPRGVLLAALVASPAAFAQVPPDAGRLLQEMTIPPQPIKPSVELELAENETPAGMKTGGAQVVLTRVSFHGATKFGPEILGKLTEDAIGKRYDLAGLRQLANRVTRFYRESGYPFARAYLPPQRMAGGELRVDVLEGRYGKITAVGEPGLAARAQPFLAALRPGEVIEGALLERVALILGDQPNVVLTPVIRPGEEVGAGDFEARISQGPRFEGQVGVDNHGNRYSGSNRLRVTGKWNSPFVLGDQIVAGGIRTNENLWLGHAGYARPLGESGLRGDISYAHTAYELGKEFAALGATGVADVTALGLSYPLMRTRTRNLILTVQYQRKSLEDRYRLTHAVNEKSARVIPVSLQFDLRDGWGGGGVSYGVVSWTSGSVALRGADQRTVDDLTAHSHGSFQKLNFDAARLQYLSPSLSLFARFAGQYSRSNLDSSEKFSLGGGSGVRAYPSGEGNGDRGWFGQLELRYNAGQMSPFAFVDAGAARVNARPWMAGENHRRIAGGGLGLRFAQDRLSLDGSLAWSLRGGDPQSDSRRQRPHVWLKADYAL